MDKTTISQQESGRIGGLKSAESKRMKREREEMIALIRAMREENKKAATIQKGENEN